MECNQNSKTTVKCAGFFFFFFFFKSIVDSVIVADILSATMHLASVAQLYVRGANGH